MIIVFRDIFIKLNSQINIVWWDSKKTTNDLFPREEPAKIAWSGPVKLASEPIKQYSDDNMMVVVWGGLYLMWVSDLVSLSV
mgnify:CR=1 FL=1